MNFAEKMFKFSQTPCIRRKKALSPNKSKALKKRKSHSTFLFYIFIFWLHALTRRKQNTHRKKYNEEQVINV